MRKLSTLCLDNLSKQEKHALNSKSQPKQQTLDFIRQFARAYQVEPALRPDLCGFVMN